MSQTASPSTLLLTVGALAETLSTSIRTIHRLNSSGKIPRPIRLGGQLRWSRAEIDGWIAAGMPDRQTWGRIRKSP